MANTNAEKMAMLAKSPTEVVSGIRKLFGSSFFWKMYIPQVMLIRQISPMRAIVESIDMETIFTMVTRLNWNPFSTESP